MRELKELSILGLFILLLGIFKYPLIQSVSICIIFIVFIGIDKYNNNKINAKKYITYIIIYLLFSICFKNDFKLYRVLNKNDFPNNSAILGTFWLALLTTTLLIFQLPTKNKLEIPLLWLYKKDFTVDRLTAITIILCGNVIFCRGEDVSLVIYIIQLYIFTFLLVYSLKFTKKVFDYYSSPIILEKYIDNEKDFLRLLELGEVTSENRHIWLAIRVPIRNWKLWIENLSQISLQRSKDIIIFELFEKERQCNEIYRNLNANLKEKLSEYIFLYGKKYTLVSEVINESFVSQSNIYKKKNFENCEKIYLYQEKSLVQLLENKKINNYHKTSIYYKLLFNESIETNFTQNILQVKKYFDFSYKTIINLLTMFKAESALCIKDSILYSTNEEDKNMYYVTIMSSGNQLLWLEGVSIEEIFSYDIDQYIAYLDKYSFSNDEKQTFIKNWYESPRNLDDEEIQKEINDIKVTRSPRKNADKLFIIYNIIKNFKYINLEGYNEKEHVDFFKKLIKQASTTIELYMICCIILLIDDELIEKNKERRSINIFNGAIQCNKNLKYDDLSQFIIQFTQYVIVAKEGFPTYRRWFDELNSFENYFEKSFVFNKSTTSNKIDKLDFHNSIQKKINDLSELLTNTQFKNIDRFTIDEVYHRKHVQTAGLIGGFTTLRQDLFNNNPIEFLLFKVIYYKYNKKYLQIGTSDKKNISNREVLEKYTDCVNIDFSDKDIDNFINSN